MNYAVLLALPCYKGAIAAAQWINLKENLQF